MFHKVQKSKNLNESCKYLKNSDCSQTFKVKKKTFSFVIRSVHCCLPRVFTVIN